MHRRDLGPLPSRVPRPAPRLGHALGLGDPGLLHHVGGQPATDRVEVLVVVGDVLDLHDVELETEGLDVVVGLVDQLLGELQPVLVDLLG